MNQQVNPFNLDLTKLFSVDPQDVVAQWQQALERLQVPGVDMSAIIATQQRNVESLAAANQAALAGFQALVKRQQELLQEAVAEATERFKAFDPSADPAENLGRQTEMTREALEKALVNMQELAELAGSSQKATLDAIQKRYAESIEEIKAQMQAATGGK